MVLVNYCISKANVKLSDVQLNKLKTAVKGTDNKTKNKIKNVFNNNMSTYLKLSRAQVSKIIQSGGFLGRLHGPFLKTGLPLIKNMIKPLAKTVLISLGLTAAASTADAGIHKKIFGSGTITLIISNEEISDIIKIVQALEDSNILLKGITKTIKNETKEQKGGNLVIIP